MDVFAAGSVDVLVTLTGYSARRPKVKTVLVIPNFLHFRIIEATVLLGICKGLETVLYPCPVLHHVEFCRLDICPE